MRGSDKGRSHACRRWGSASAVSVRSSAASHPPIDLGTARLLGFFSRHAPHGLGETPDMALRILRRVDTVAVKFILKFADDYGSSGLGSRAIMRAASRVLPLFSHEHLEVFVLRLNWRNHN